MAEILTESFCERCGTRYTFESGAPKARLKGLKVMSRGLRNFVMSDDTSMDEAMAAARNETDREQTSHQLDAFHKTFNFCMTCRQYTCGNCWNEAEGRCLSCAPNLGQEIMPAPFGNVAAGGAMTLTDAETVGLHEHNGHDLGAPPAEPLAWPTSDLMREAEAASMPETAPAWPPDAPASFEDAVAEAAARPETFADAALSDEGVADEPLADDEDFDFAARFETVAGPAAGTPVTEDRVEPVPEPVVERIVEPEIAAVEDVPEPAGAPAPAVADAAPEVDDRAAAAAANTSDLFHRFRPGQNLDDEIEAYERAQAAETVAKSAAAAAVTTPSPEPDIIAPEPVYPEPERPAVETFEAEPVVAAEPEPEPVVAAEPEPEPVVAAEPEPEPVVAAEPRVDYVPQPTWQIVAPDTPTTDGVPAPTVQQPTQPPADAVAASSEPQWPATPQWPERDASAGLPFLGRPAAATGGIDALWAASAQEVARVSDVPQAGPAAVKPGGVQPCVSCGLSLSANARFCRRCGTRQG
jgi:hypothetical protein